MPSARCWLAAFRCHNDHGDATPTLDDPPGQLDAAQAGELDVSNDQVDVLFFEHLQRVFREMRNADLVGAVLVKALRLLADEIVIVNN